MLLKGTISSTKKFFKNTIQSFKSMLSGGYEKLPKTPPFNNPFSCTTIGDPKMHQSFREFDNFYADFTNRWDLDTEEKAKKRSKNKVVVNEHAQPIPKKDEQHVVSKQNFMKLDKQRSDNVGEKCSTNSSSHRGRELVAQRLKELELMDLSNVDHVLDIEEVLHYYARLTSPVYLDIVDRFFVQVYSEFFQSPMSAGGNGN